MSKILIVCATFYEDIAQNLVRSCIDEIGGSGYEYEIINVAGAFEIPAAINFASGGSNSGNSGNSGGNNGGGNTGNVNNAAGNSEHAEYVGYVALGCVIRGETTHYDYVCQESARGLNSLAINRNLAIGYGIITAENMQQAVARAEKKGAAAAKACIDMINIKRRFL